MCRSALKSSEPLDRDYVHGQEVLEVLPDVIQDLLFDVRGHFSTSDHEPGRRPCDFLASLSFMPGQRKSHGQPAEQGLGYNAVPDHLGARDDHEGVVDVDIEAKVARGAKRLSPPRCEGRHACP